MNVTTTSWSVERLTREAQKQRLRRRDEYQRGETWTDLQKQRFVDSLFRDYPVPAIFVHVVKEPDPCDNSIMGSELYVVDGQQRLSALCSYVFRDLLIPDLSDKSKLRLPDAIRSQPAPWTGKTFGELGKELQISFLNRQISVHQIETEVDEEVRDLFIRLQAGTSLSPQQVRDAWPGSLSPFVERFGGKFLKSPHRLFTLIDKRGDKNQNEDERKRRDLHVASRQLCAQLLLLFLQQVEGPGEIPSVGAKQLDELYHVNASFPKDGREQQALRFSLLLDLTAQIVEVALSYTGKRTMPKLEVFSSFLLLERLEREPDFVLNSRLRRIIGEFSSRYPEREMAGKRTKAGTISTYFSHWKRSLLSQVDAPELQSLCKITCPEEQSEDEWSLDDFDM
jgi:hypothetical protein